MPDGRCAVDRVRRARLADRVRLNPEGAPKCGGGSGNAVKAIVQARYGLPDVLQLKDIDKPRPEDDEVLVRVHAAAACSSPAWASFSPRSGSAARPGQRLGGMARCSDDDQSTRLTSAGRLSTIRLTSKRG